MSSTIHINGVCHVPHHLQPSHRLGYELIKISIKKIFKISAK